MKFNIVITCKGRKEHLNKCIEYLNYANINHQHDICVYIVYSDVNRIKKADNINIKTFKLKDEDKHFNKSRYINYGMSKMRDDYDYFMQWDCDLICSYNLFSLICITDKDWIVLSGFKLTEEATKKVLNSKEELELDSLGVIAGSKFENQANRYVGPGLKIFVIGGTFLIEVLF